MVPTPLNLRTRSPGILVPIAQFIVHHVPKLITTVLYGQDAASEPSVNAHTWAKRKEKHDTKFVVFAVLIPILVLLSGLFAGLTLGYMSLDETQLHVLSTSGTPKQKEYARKIEPIRKNGHLLLVTLLLANMIVNESLPVISDPVLGGGVQSVVVSTVLIVIFSEIIPQSLCTRYGLAIGAQMAWFVRILIYALGVVAWPVAKLLELTLGPHHGIMYRRGELKELIAMHAATGELGGDLNKDTITIIGATLDLQEKVVKQAMTPIENVFMLDIETKLDPETMRKIGDTGHSRIPVYEEVEVLSLTNGAISSDEKSVPSTSRKAKKIIGILLVKQCLMLDPKDATPLRSLKLNSIPCVVNNMSLLTILDRFQNGRSHMAIVSRYSEERAASVKKEVKKNLTRRLKERIGISDSSGSETDPDSDSSDDENETETNAEGSVKGSTKKGWRRRSKRKGSKGSQSDIEKGDRKCAAEKEDDKTKGNAAASQGAWAKLTAPGREQLMPDDAVLPKDNANEFLSTLDPSIAPLGIITLEDVLEELIGEEIYDEFDREGGHLTSYVSPRAGKKLLSRGRDAYSVPQFSPGAAAEGTTAVSAVDYASSAPKPTATRSYPISMPPSPNLAASHDDGTISRTPSLGHSINALAIHRKVRHANERSQSPAASGALTHRDRSQQRRSRSEGEMAVQGFTPSSAPRERIADLHKEPQDMDGLRIPDAQERSGPDIAHADGERKKD